MLNDIFYTDQDNNLRLNSDSLLEQTDWEYANTVTTKVGDDPVKELIFGGDRRARCVYFKTAAGQFSFAYQKKEGVLLFSEQINSDWKFVIGWKPLC